MQNFYLIEADEGSKLDDSKWEPKYYSSVQNDGVPLDQNITFSSDNYDIPLNHKTHSYSEFGSSSSFPQ
jgi:hypothetical protein